MSDKICVPLGYDEKENNLAIRINAHKKFSNFSLEDWIAGHVALKKGSVVLDIGCGNGNLFPTYSEKVGVSGLIVGIDKSLDLLREAKNQRCKTPKFLLEYDMNSRFLFVDSSFDYVFSSFAIYYVNDVLAIVDEIARVMAAGGEAILIGPTNNNAKELYDFNEKVFGFSRDEKINRRTNRIEDEFYPVFQKKFEEVSIDRIPSKLVFSNKEEFLRYYLATLLFEESVKKSGAVFDVNRISDVKLSVFEVSKEIIVLRGKKGA